MSLNIQSGVELFVYQGARLFLPVYWVDQFKNPINVTGYKAKFQLRGSPTNIEVIIDLSTENDGIQVFGPQGMFLLLQDASITAEYPVPFSGEYDLFIYPDGDADQAIPVIWGPGYIKPKITR